MEHDEWSRRQLFRRSALLGAAVLGGPVLLSACTSTSSGDALQAAKDAKKVKVAVLSAAVEKGYATDAGVPESQIETLDSQDNMLRAVTDGRVYCAALTDISLKDVLKKNPGAAAEVTPGFDPVKDGKPVISAGGFVFRTGDNPFLGPFNTELKEPHDSRAWTKLLISLGFTQAN